MFARGASPGHCCPAVARSPFVGLPLLAGQGAGGSALPAGFDFFCSACSPNRTSHGGFGGSGAMLSRAGEPPAPGTGNSSRPLDLPAPATGGVISFLPSSPEHIHGCRRALPKNGDGTLTPCVGVPSPFLGKAVVVETESDIEKLHHARVCRHAALSRTGR
jgi:hypothetical protein